MSKRHELRAGDWESTAGRLDEIISAHSGEDPFEEALKLMVAKLSHESGRQSEQRFLLHESGTDPIREVNRLLAVAGQRWRGVLEPSTETKLSGPELVRCADVLASVRLLGDDLVGLDAIFEFMVNKASKGQKGQYFTPRHVISAVVDMVQPRKLERVADPACGSAGFLRHALLHEQQCSVWGFDQDQRAIRVARVMMAASGQQSSRVMRCDSLRLGGTELFPDATPILEDLIRAQDPKFRGFDVILTNPPFAGDVGAEYANDYELARGKRVERDALFVERCVKLLRPGGRIGIVLPHNKVGGESWGFLRQWVLEHLQVVAVLGLGRNTFQPHTSQKACVVLGVKRTRPEKQFGDEEILFFISEKDGKDHRGRLTTTEKGVVDHDLGDIVPLVRSRFDAIENRRA